MLLLIKLSQCVDVEDYFDEEFDPNKNCVREEEMKKLRGEAEPERCATARRQGKHSKQSGALSLVQITRDTVLSLVEPFYAGAKVYAITTHRAGVRNIWISLGPGELHFYVQKEVNIVVFVLK